MFQKSSILAALTLLFASGVSAADISGQYLETRTCQVYTGPCFANAEVGLCGRDAIMAWSIQDGIHDGVELAGLKVVVALKSDRTLGFGGIEDAGKVKSVIYVDEKATAPQRQALIRFAKSHSGRAGQAVVRVTSAPIEMSLDESELAGKLDVGRAVKLVSRKARPDDCICSNESAYYPPLTQVENFAPGVATVGEFKGWGLGTQWSTPGARSVYMATFAY